MKNSRNEKLSEYLLHVDEDIMNNAYVIDDAVKLKRYIKEKNKKTKRAVYIPQGFRRAGVAVACFILILGILISIIPKPKTPGETPSLPTVIPPWVEGDESPVSINSIDMLNYYTAIRALSVSQNTVMSSREISNGVKLLSAYSDEKFSVKLLNDRESGNEVFTDAPPEYEDTPDYNPPATAPEKENIIYYELSPDEVFSVTRVVFFQIELTDERGFLASKVGTGIVDVVITENSLEPMITLKNGDRYFSCCENSVTENGKLYSTHKYIEGFYIVKNLEQENYSISVYYDNFRRDYIGSNAVSIDCQSYKNGGSSPDGTISVVSTTYVSNEGVEMTIAELEEYFNTGKLPEGSQSTIPSYTENLPETGEYDEYSQRYSNGIYVFDLVTDGCFIYVGAELNSDFYRKGTYELTGDMLELKFVHEGEIEEIATCILINDTFIYNGSEYYLQS